ncbi:XRE family transcriptional regulator [Micromonospora sp. NPDC005203]|uniref:XRE family transcriptional regulator n=1 Tax=Micromonospora sp. NPDC005203 TaxID=3364226 RepID=UPI003686DD77
MAGMIAAKSTLRAVGTGMRLGQAGFAHALQSASRRVGEPNDANKKPVQRCESGGGHDLTSPMSNLATPTPKPLAVHGSYEGVWLSRYQFHSSGRGESFAGQHFVVVLQHGDRLNVRSLPGSAASSLAMDLTVDGAVVTGTWVEQTDPAGYYRGARYHGAIQLLGEPTGRRMAGKWVGFGKDMDVNTGPWELTFQAASTSKATLDRYNTSPDESASGQSSRG